ncbi:Flp family type IVb pilin [Trinickia acidisoli]|uniref:Flp family type IVb pilin n=1 Tax=Trinickia acidisoli TaxID=2767482 RepID=UPI001A8D84F7|nr:Flp family type IVb pilin [Trinickia acidisoli]
MLRFLRFLSRDERGVSALEYSVLAGIVVVAVAAAGAIFGGTSGLPALFQNLITNVTSVQASGK